MNLPALRNVSEVQAAETVVTNETELQTALAAGGTVKVANDFNVNKVITIDGSNALLNLNGKTITGLSNGIIRIKSGSLTLDGNGVAKGEFSLSGTNSVFSIKSGTITQSKYEAVNVKEGAIFNMYDGLITKCDWDGVAAYPGGIINMFGGTITDNSMADIYVAKESSLIMSGGTINTLSLASSQAVESAKFSIKGAPVIKKTLSLITDSKLKSTIDIVGPLENGCSVAVSAPKNVDFTKNYKMHNGTVNPNNYFKCDGYGFTLSSTTGEVQMVDKASAMTTSTSNTTTSSVTPTYTPSYTSSSSSWSIGTSASSYSSSGSSGGGGSGDSTSFSDGGTKTAGKGTAKADYKKSGKTGVKYVLSDISEKAKKASIPNTVKIGKKTYKVVAVSESAFIGLKNLISVTLGKNVKKLEKGMISNCRKLKTLTIQSKKFTKKNVKGAFKGANIKTIYVPASKVKAYKKVFTKKNTGNKSKISVKAKK